ncbi:MAG TPA: VOC family protein [Glaciibacter sp.]|nr:VOC family protein [Glaciibacter sp.]
MERVTGIGGFFFRARDPEALTRWYSDNLGITPPPTSYEENPWLQTAGPTIFTAMGNDSDVFGAADRSWSINFRVGDLDAMVAQLEAAGVAVTRHPDTYPNGRFAELRDPEGNGIQLWEPMGVASLGI